jgi:hypothetical protein
VRLLQPGQGEALKAGVHASLGLLAGVCVLYNSAAWISRRDAHLARNAWFYGLVLAVELIQVQRHCR